MTALDTAIIAEYRNFATPADRIVTDPWLAAEFCAAVNRRLSPDFHVDQAPLSKRLLNLRKRGEANGGLPRLERSRIGNGAGIS